VQFFPEFSNWSGRISRYETAAFILSWRNINSTFGLGTQLEARSVVIENTPNLGKTGKGKAGGRITTPLNVPRLLQSAISAFRKAFFNWYGRWNRSR
jgi:hypothetical protein